MSLKLSNNQERIGRLLENEAFEDKLYLQLFKLYDWSSDGLHESNENRDVTISFVKRFFRPDGFRDPAMIYAPTTVMNITQDTDSPEVLDAILTMPNHQIKVSKKEQFRPKNLRELVAFNESISIESIRYLLSLNSNEINYFLAGNSAITHKQQERIFFNSDNNIKMMLTHNSSLSDELFNQLLLENSEITKSLLSYQPINQKRLDIVLKKEFNSEILSYLGDNQTIESIETLLRLDIRELDFRLASNSIVTTKQLDKLYTKYDDDIIVELSQNSNLSIELMKKFYNQGNNLVINELATNHSTPKEILTNLCKRDDRELNKLLASNPSVELHYLQQFQLDPSLIMILAKNETYGRNVLKGLGI